MSIPLDRLYDHLYYKSNHDMLIYVWTPHGSRKLSDLTQWKPTFLRSWIDRMTMPLIIMHDQEPLEFDLWTADDFFQQLKQKIIENASDSNFGDKEINFHKGLHLRGVIAPSCNLNDYVIIVHSEQNSHQVDQYKQNGFLPVYFWSHALIAADWFRYSAHDNLLDFDSNQFKSDFLIYNRAWTGSREYRLTFAELLANSNMISRCLTSFSPTDSGNYYADHQFKNTSLAINHNKLHEVFDLNNHSSAASADYNNLDYAKTGIEVVLETLFDDSRLHLTEKTLRPIACGKPFMLAATPGSLQYLKNYGFETFGTYINEDYDLIKDPVDRLQALVREMKRISLLPENQKRTLWKKLHMVAKRNKKRFFSKTWQQNIEQEFYNNLDKAMIVMQQHCTGKYWKQAQSMPFFSQLYGPSDKQRMQKLTAWLNSKN